MAVAAQDETRVRRAGDDLFLAAGEIDWRSETSGDALVAGGEIDLRGDIHGAAVVAGGRRTVASKIDQDGLRAFAVCAECLAPRHANPAHKIVAGAGARDTRSSRCADCGGSALGDGDRRSPGADCTVDAAGFDRRRGSDRRFAVGSFQWGRTSEHGATSLGADRRAAHVVFTYQCASRRRVAGVYCDAFRHRHDCARALQSLVLRASASGGLIEGQPYRGR
jgi:hypothetical protein